MSYRSGIYIGSNDDGPPRITCDDCGVQVTIGDGVLPPSWFIDGKAKPGWKLIRHENGTRTDYCATCKSKHKVAAQKAGE